MNVTTDRKRQTLKCQNCPSFDRGVFCGLDQLKLDNVCDHKVVNTYSKGQNLFVQGNPPYGLFCLASGNVKVSSISSTGKEVILKIATGGDILGHKGIFTEDFYMETATTLEDTTVCFLDKKFIINIIRENPVLAQNILTRLGKEMGAAEKKISSFYQKNVRERLAEFLLLLKESHGEKIEKGLWKLNIKLSREEMAATIGTATETLIRFMSEFKEEGIIEEKNKTIYIVREENLIDSAALNNHSF